ncbi:Scr1 family TA system antitoxin-like transcriptional regulator [Streptomyces sp. NPDC015171]|uniref:Scr1 family TA system antitoxin-like transcriptional regulator n=1 Tax=Streptomyces sp. NPDC015171 TaxID=3364945 RepID=UPI0036F70173
MAVCVVPLDLDGFSWGGSSMTYMGGPLPALDTVLRDAPHGTVYVDAEAQLDTYRTRFRKVEGMSLEPEPSRDFIRRLAQEL